jgi:phage terminase large subunit
MRNREFTSGVDRLSAARELGYDMTIVPSKRVEEGIQAVRSLLNQCFFDPIECKQGIQCLDFYRKKWNDALKIYYDEPLHDRWSHGADAFRMLAIGLNAYQSSGSLTPDKIREMRMKHRGA